MSKKFIIKFALILSAMLLVTISTIYLLPEKYTATVIANSNLDIDDTATLMFSLKERKHFFRPTQITGVIEFNNIKYESMSTTRYDVYKSNSFFENIKLKFQGFRYDIFVRTDMLDNPLELLNDTITIQSLTKTELIIYKSDEMRNGTTIYNVDMLHN